MVHAATNRLTLEEFWALPENDITYELVAGVAVAKVSPKRFHAGVQKALVNLLDEWSSSRGHFYPEWAVALKRQGEDWVPVPDLTYVSYDRLPVDWLDDAACPVAPDLVIEIISPGQTFGELIEKSTNYLEAGVAIVWVIDPRAQTVTVFHSDTLPRTFAGATCLNDPLLEGLEIIPCQLFQQAGLPGK
jgi:Uma2 family endonuclease